MSEEKIIEQCRRGDFSSFGELYDKYIKRIYDFVYFKTHHRETAEDIVSRVFIKVFENIKFVDTHGGSFKAWIYTIARNQVIDHYRTQKKDKNIDDVWDLAEKKDVVRDLDAKNKLEKVEEYLSNLKSEHREIVIMRVWQEMSYKEIAEISGKSEASCKMMLGRVLKKLKAEMPLSSFISLLLIVS